jgi:diadenosine tetraphosphate (Ap4A) HIT family hydrolase
MEDTTSDQGRNPAIFETRHWKILLMDDQRYLGRSVVVLKRPCRDLAEVTEEEMTDFLGVVRRFEKAAREAFGATMFNWACLMNLAYQHTPPDPQVHWHVRPRYDHPVVFGGEMFTDADFGNHYARGEGDRSVSAATAGMIVAALRKIPE